MRRAALVITVSRYCAERLEELYGAKNAVVVPELIELDAWRQLFRASSVADSGKFTVLSVCRFYPRKRLESFSGPPRSFVEHFPRSRFAL